MQPFRPHAPSANGVRVLRPLPSPLTDGGALPPGLKTYNNAYISSFNNSPYGDASPSVTLMEADDQYLHPRTSIPGDVACWSVPNAASSQHVGPISVGRDAVLFDTGCVGVVGTHTFYFMVTPGSFSTNPADFSGENIDWASNDLGSDRLAVGAQEALLNASAAARYWRDLPGQSALGEMLPSGVSTSAWDYMLRFVAFPGCGCRTKYSASTVRFRVETVSVDDFARRSETVSGAVVGDGCPPSDVASDPLGPSTSETSAVGIAALSGCDQPCPNGTLYAITNKNGNEMTSDDVLAGMSATSPKNSITTDCPSCGNSSVEVPYDIAQMMVRNGCYRIEDFNGGEPCCTPDDPGNKNKQSVRIIPDFSSPICSAFRDEVVCAPSCCLVVGTKVMTTEGLKPVEELRPNEILVSVRPISSMSDIDINITDPRIRDPWPADYVIYDHLVKVSEINVGMESNYFVINGSLKLTSEHAMPILRENNVYYKSASGVQVGDQILGQDGYWKYVHSVERLEENVATVSISTSGGNLYIASGFVVHNSDAGFSDSGFDFGGAVGLGITSGVDEISLMESFAELRSKIKVEI